MCVDDLLSSSISGRLLILDQNTGSLTELAADGEAQVWATSLGASHIYIPDGSTENTS